jgi:polyisoprenoid-binding protein YceI
MTTLTCDDLTANQGKAKLEGHLKSDDFFSVEKFNKATLTILSVQNSNATGVLTIKDISHPIEFKLTKNKDTYSADLVFDRSKYNVKYASGNFFKNLGDKLILDEIELSAQLKLN